MRDEVREFLKKHELAVLSTIDREGAINGVVVNYLLDDDCLYVLTKSGTGKAHDMLGNSQVAMTIYDADELKAAQVRGTAAIEADLNTKQRVFKEIARPRDYGGDVLMPPVTQLSAGGFIIFKITPKSVKYSSFKDSLE